MLDARRLIACAAIVAAIFVGCAKRPALIGASAPAPTGAAATSTVTAAEVAASPAAPAAPAPVAAAPEPVRPAPKEFVAIDALKPIYFDFDKYDIRPADAKVLDTNATWLKSNANHLVLIEGHCDERGTNAYNLALGERRAKAAQEYVAARGVDAARIVIISYGEERPVCTAHNAACWAQNRRAHFLTKQP
jgi:peptidoglycan-associated lipoprotein